MTRRWAAPWAFSLSVLAASFAVTFLLCVAKTGGAFVYPLDDAYIHLALAKNLAEGGGYGIAPGEFTPTSSSVVWPWLLAGLRSLSGSALVPLILNAVAAGAMVVFVERRLRAAGRGPWARFGGSVAVVAGLPVLPLVFIGMEHTAHALFSLLVAVHVARALAGDRVSIRACVIGGLLAAASVGLRYEGAFLVGVAVALALLRRRWGLAGALAIGALLPIALQGVFALRGGAPFFPISLLLKRPDVPLASLPGEVARRLRENLHVPALLVALAWAQLARRRLPFWEPGRLLLLLATGALVAHLVFAQLGWFFRYEAYAVGLALLALAETVSVERVSVAPACLAVLVALPVAYRAGGGLRAVPAASANIFEQQMQAARFIGAYYPGRRVVLNDIGAVAYFTDARVVDLMGLGSMDVFRVRMSRSGRGLDRSDVESLTGGADLAIVYDDWFTGTLPPAWRRVGGWRIANNKVCAKDAVSIYATRAEDEDALARNLRAFAPRLPTTVQQSGLYLGVKAD